jgi:hypothetical protein
LAVDEQVVLGTQLAAVDGVRPGGFSPFWPGR